MTVAAPELSGAAAGKAGTIRRVFALLHPHRKILTSLVIGPPMA